MTSIPSAGTAQHYKLLGLIAFLVFVSLFLSACGGGDSGSSSNAATPVTAGEVNTPAPPAPPAPPAVTPTPVVTPPVTPQPIVTPPPIVVPPVTPSPVVTPPVVTPPTTSNHAPVAQAASLTVSNSGSDWVKLQATDADGDTLTFRIVTQPAHGTLKLGQGNVYIYTPTSGYEGDDSFSFVANDGTVDSAAAVVSVRAYTSAADNGGGSAPANQAPQGKAASISTDEGAAKEIALEGSDPDGNPLTYRIVTQPKNGTLSTISGNKVIYTPNVNYGGLDAFTFQVNDGSVNSNPANIDLAILSNGKFIDSVVSGLQYSTDTQAGITTNDGVFKYIKGEYVTFHLGKTTLGKFKPMSNGVVHVYDLTVDDSVGEGRKVAQLLQSLDYDNNSSNGIQITEAVRQFFGNTDSMTLGVTDAAFKAALEQKIITLGRQIVPMDVALQHADSTLKNISTNCGFPISSLQSDFGGGYLPQNLNCRSQAALYTYVTITKPSFREQMDNLQDKQGNLEEAVSEENLKNHLKNNVARQLMDVGLAKLNQLDAADKGKVMEFVPELSKELLSKIKIIITLAADSIDDENVKKQLESIDNVQEIVEGISKVFSESPECFNKDWSACAKTLKGVIKAGLSVYKVGWNQKLDATTDDIFNFVFHLLDTFESAADASSASTIQKKRAAVFGIWAGGISMLGDGAHLYNDSRKDKTKNEIDFVNTNIDNIVNLIFVNPLKVGKECMGLVSGIDLNKINISIKDMSIGVAKSLATCGDTIVTSVTENSARLIVYSVGIGMTTDNLNNYHYFSLTNTVLEELFKYGGEGSTALKDKWGVADVASLVNIVDDKLAMPDWVVGFDLFNGARNLHRTLVAKKVRNIAASIYQLADELVSGNFHISPTPTSSGMKYDVYIEFSYPTNNIDVGMVTCESSDSNYSKASPLVIKTGNTYADKATFVFTKTGVHIVQCSVFENRGGLLGMQSVGVDVKATYSFGIGYTFAVGDNDKTPTLSIEDNAADSVKLVRWDFGDGTSVIALPSDSVKHEFAAYGSHTVTLTLFDNTGVVGTQQFAFDIDQKLTVAPALSPAVPANGKVMLTWSTVPNAKEYVICYSQTSIKTQADCDYLIKNQLTPTTKTTDITVDGLTNNSLYYFRVEAANGNQYSPPSGEVSATPTDTAITKITPLTGVAGKTVTLSITGSNLPPTIVANIASQSKGCTTTKVEATTASFDCPLDVAGDYALTIKTDVAKNGGKAIIGGNATFSVTQDQGLSAPNVTATPDDKQVTLTWAAVSTATGYNVCWSSNPIDDAANCNKAGVFGVGTTKTEFTVDSLTNGDTYYFRVIATKGSQYSGMSTPVQAVPGKVACKAAARAASATAASVDCQPDASISTITPLTGTGGQTATLNITGSNLPTTIVANIATQKVGCTTTKAEATSASFDCPLDVAGSYALTITPTNGGKEIIGGSATFTVAQDQGLSAVITKIDPLSGTACDAVMVKASGSHLPNNVVAKIDAQSAACTTVITASGSALFNCPLDVSGSHALSIKTSNGVGITGGDATFTVTPHVTISFEKVLKPYEVTKADGSKTTVSTYSPADFSGVIVGDVLLQDGTLDLQGQTLTIQGNLVHSGGTLNVNNGTLVVMGDYRIQTPNDGGCYTASGGVLYMVNAADKVQVGGSFVMDSISNHRDYGAYLNAGVLEVKGDFTQKSSNDNGGHSPLNFYAQGSHKVVLSGTGKQTVSFEDGASASSRLANLQVDNLSAEGVVFANRVLAVGTMTTGVSGIPKISGYLPGTTLGSDFDAIGSALNMVDGLNVAGKTLKVSGDLLHPSGTLNVNGGKLLVTGDYRIQTPDGKGSYAASSGVLYMIKAEDRVQVNGSFVMDSISNHRDYGAYLNAGVLEVKGDFTQKSSNDNGGHSPLNFYAQGSHKVVLSGTGKQTVSFEDGASTASRLVNLQIDNLSAEGVVFANRVWAIGKMDTSKTGIPNISGYIPGTALGANFNAIGKTLIMSDGLNLVGNSLTVAGDLIHTSGTLHVQGGTLVVNGDYRIQSPDDKGGYAASSGVLYMVKSEDRVQVNGSFVMDSTSNHRDYGAYLNAGVLEVKGDFTQKSSNDNGGHSPLNFYAQGSHKVVLSGTSKQIVSFEDGVSGSSRFDNLQIDNLSTEGVVFNNHIGVVGTLAASNGSIPKLSGYMPLTTLDSDFEVIGDTLTISDGLNLAGKTLKVMGNLIHTGGTLNINGGKLLVAGDYRIQTPDGKGGYAASSGVLYMIKAEDRVQVNGSFVMDSISNHRDYGAYLNAGVLEVKGDFTQKSSNDNGGHSPLNFYAQGSHKVVLSGAGKQIVSFEDGASASSRLVNLQIDNLSAEGVVFANRVLAVGTMTTGVPGIPKISGYLPGTTLGSDFDAIGSAPNMVDGLNVAGKTLKVTGNLVHLGGTLNINAGKLLVTGDYRIQTPDGKGGYAASSGVLYMIKAEDRVQVNGSFVMDSISNHRDYGAYLNAGVLEVKGDFTQKSSNDNGGHSPLNFYAQGSHKVVLSGTSRQKVSFEDNGASRFATLQLDNSAGVDFDTPITVSVLFEHNHHPFTLATSSPSSFADYDGDGVSDNLDSSPQVKTAAKAEKAAVTEPQSEAKESSGEQVSAPDAVTDNTRATSTTAGMAGTAATSCSKPIKSILFTDTFDGAIMDMSKWDVDQTGGTVTLVDGKLSVLSGGISRFPLIQTKTNPFPATGDFSFYCKANYSHIGADGTSACAAVEKLAAIGDGTIVWADLAHEGTYLKNLGVIASVSPWDTAAHEYEVCVIGSRITTYRDGTAVDERTLPDHWQRPTKVFMGNPVSGNGDWSTFDTDSVEVRQLVE